MLFATLHARLLEHLRDRVRNGELTERSLARLTGISQPHMHNVLKGARILSLELTDHVILCLQFSMLDLIDRKELSEYLDRGAQQKVQYRNIPMLRGHIGPGHAPPATARAGQQRPVPADLLFASKDPVVARLSEDPDMGTRIRAGDLVLLNRAELARCRPTPDRHYLVRFKGQGLIRRVLSDRGGLSLISEKALGSPKQWLRVPLGDADILEVVLAGVVWLSSGDDPRLV